MNRPRHSSTAAVALVRGRVLPFSALLAACLTAACNRPIDPLRRKPEATVVTYSITAEEILRRCATAHGRARTMTAQGVLRAYHKSAPRVVPISWTFERPGRCKLQIEKDAVIVLGRDWWSYQASSARFARHHQFTRTPIQTAAMLLTDGLPMLIDELFVEGEATLKPTGMLGRPGWRIEGAAWAGGHPCYVLSRMESGQRRSQELTLWVDQDSFLLRAWKLTAPGFGNGERLIAGCDYHDLAADVVLTHTAFSLEPPTPLEIPESTPSGATDAAARDANR